MRCLVRKCSRPAGLMAVFSVTCCVLLMHTLTRDPLSRWLPRTYSDLMRGPMVLAQDDPVVIEIIKKMFDGPSSQPYNLQWSAIEDTSEHGQQAYLLDIIGGKRGGSFLEAGAFNGEIHSNTLYLERFMNWTGVLVEASRWNYRQLLLTHRRSRSLNVCLSPTSYPQQFGFEEMPGSLLAYVDTEFKRADLGRQMRPRQCFPLYSVLLAAGLTSLDFLSLDVEGIEHQVLQTIPWQKVDIKIVMVEYVKPDFRFENGSYDPILEEPITEVMLANSYLLVHRLETDLIFVKNSSEYAI